MSEQSTRQEVGYVLLEECEVLVDITSRAVESSAADNTLASGSHLSTGIWYDIYLNSAAGVTHKDIDVASSTDGSFELVLRPNNKSFTNTNKISPFNGLMSEIFNGQPVTKSKRKSTRRRSDASLLLGLGLEINQQANQFEQEVTSSASDTDAVRSQYLRHIQMKNIQIMFWEGCEQNSRLEDTFVLEETTDESNSDNSEMQHPSAGKRMKASLLVTFSLPKHDNTTLGESQEETHGTRTKSKSKRLSSALQLLASIIRCDWKHLDAIMDRLQKEAVSKATTSNNQRRESPRPHFFPDSLNVEELYHRISGANQHFTHVESSSGSEVSSNTVQFLNLPIDIVATSIAPYLRAKSLYALRSTNRKLHKSLRQVVPGLKLKLFQHQVRSLDWMEMRERRCITEGDLLCRRSHDALFLDEEAVCGGDYHRAVTGGATVLLSARPEGDKDAQNSMRFDVQSGCVVASVDSSLERKTMCARGG